MDVDTVNIKGAVAQKQKLLKLELCNELTIVLAMFCMHICTFHTHIELYIALWSMSLEICMANYLSFDSSGFLLLALELIVEVTSQITHTTKHIRKARAHAC